MTLLEKVRRNEAGAWERLVGLYTPLVCYWCDLAGLRRPNTETVGHKLFAAVSEGLSEFDCAGDGANFRNWVREIARRVISEHFATPPGEGTQDNSDQQHRTEIAGLEIREDDASHATEKNILYHRAIAMIEDALEPTTRQAFWLLISGRSPKDITRELEMSATSVYMAKSNVLRLLKQEFAGLIDLTPVTHSPPTGSDQQPDEGTP
jgi:RNA polymerase sigma-70 factor (ECF subfamily)